MRLELVAGDVTGRRVEKAGNPVDDRRAGVLDRGRLHDMELRVGLAGDPPVAHVAVVRAVHLADGLFLDRDALHGLDGDHRGHADAVAGRDGLAQRCAVYVVVHDAGHMLLCDGPDGQSQLAADGLAGVPRVGGLEFRGVGDLLLKFLGRQAAAVGVGQSKAVVLHVVAVGALDLLDFVAAAGHHGDHVDPENILHAGSGDRAVVFSGQSVQTVDLRCRSRPRIDGLLAGRDHVDAAGDAFFHMVVDVPDEAEQGDDGHVRIARIQNAVGVVGNDDACFQAQPGVVAHIHADDLRVHVDGAYDLGAVLVQIAQGVLRHFAASILHNLDFFHISSSFTACVVAEHKRCSLSILPRLSSV